MNELEELRAETKRLRDERDIAQAQLVGEEALGRERMLAVGACEKSYLEKLRTVVAERDRLAGKRQGGVVARAGGGTGEADLTDQVS